LAVPVSNSDRLFVYVAKIA